MPNPFSDAPRDASGADARARSLGPYEAAYDVRRGYESADGPPPGPAPRQVREPVWIGRRSDR